MKTSSYMLSLIKGWEGLRLKAYRCPTGIWTIGYGHTQGVKPDTEITPAQAEALFLSDLATAEAQLNHIANMHNVALTAGQWDALVSFTFNVGIARLHQSTLWRKVKANPADPSIRREFMRWTRAAGRELPGLKRRRAAEADRYFNLTGNE